MRRRIHIDEQYELMTKVRDWLDGIKDQNEMFLYVPISAIIMEYKLSDFESIDDYLADLKQNRKPLPSKDLRENLIMEYDSITDSFHFMLVDVIDTLEKGKVDKAKEKLNKLILRHKKEFLENLNEKAQKILQVD